MTSGPCRSGAPRCLGERVDDALQLVFDLVGDDVLAHLVRERCAIEDLDDAFDLSPQIPHEQVANRHYVLLDCDFTVR